MRPLSATQMARAQAYAKAFPNYGADLIAKHVGSDNIPAVARLCADVRRGK